MNALDAIAREHGIVQSPDRAPALNALVLSLRAGQEGNRREVYEFLDNCLMRLARKPIVYYDLMDDLLAAASVENRTPARRLDLLLVALAEQWPHLSPSKPFSVTGDAAAWLSSYIILSMNTGGDSNLLSVFREQLMSTSTDPKCRAIFDRDLRQQPESDPRLPEEPSSEPAAYSMEADAAAPAIVEAAETDGALLPPGPPAEPQDHPELHRWAREEVQDAITDGHIGGLVLCLCSEHEAVRKESLVNLRSFAGKLEVGRSVASGRSCSPRAGVRVRRAAAELPPRQRVGGDREGRHSGAAFTFLRGGTRGGLVAGPRRPSALHVREDW